MIRFNQIFAILLSFTFTIATTSCNSAVSQDEAPQSDPEVKNIIFLIGDGMGLQQMFAAYTLNGGQLPIDNVDYVGLQKTQSSNKYITDSAASGTALACGKKTDNGMIGVDPEGNELMSILKIAEKQGLATGLVSTSGITHATPASFIANEKKRSDYENIAADFLKTDIDLFIGGGLKHFNDRKDGRDLTEDLEKNGYTVARSMEEVMNATSNKLAGFTAEGHNPRTTEGRDDMLPKSTKKAIEMLSKNNNGFFLMVEGSQIDWGGHANDEDYVMTETFDFFAAVEEAMNFAAENEETLVVITADHETGGMMILDGDMEKKKIKTTFNSKGHTGIMIPVYSYGPKSEYFSGIYDNTDFKEKFLKAWGFDGI
ncbi:MAG TPA: alkaline phosphatase [Bacteroidales bacterium]|nr:alkaline phosphatase [Bacteroidales bacterium]